MGREICQIDTGLSYSAAIFPVAHVLKVSSRLFRDLETNNPNAIIGRVAVEDGQIVNEYGMEFGIELQKVLENPRLKIVID